MRFFYHYPDAHGTGGDMLDPGPLHEVAAAAERSGFDGFSLTEHPVPGARWLASGGHQSLDPLVALAIDIPPHARAVGDIGVPRGVRENLPGTPGRVRWHP